MTGPETPLRVKFGRNPYSNDLTCAFCRESYAKGGFWLRLEQNEIVVDLPVCQACWSRGELFETLVTFDRHETSHPVSLA